MLISIVTLFVTEPNTGYVLLCIRYGTLSFSPNFNDHYYKMSTMWGKVSSKNKAMPLTKFKWNLTVLRDPPKGENINTSKYYN